MRGHCLCFCLMSLLLLFLHENNAAAQSDRKGVYIVYMGASRCADGSPRNDHAQLLSSLMKRKRDTVIHNYNNGFSGFAAHLSEEEAKSIAQRPGVVSVFPDPVLQLHTTHSWDFLKYQTSVKIDSSPAYPYAGSSAGGGSIIGILDTGIWPESKSFDDKDIGEIPQNWKGKCMEGQNFNSTNCNRKIIGARYYDNSDSGPIIMGTPRDESGHGTHVASTAGGSLVSGVSYYGLAEGSAYGGSTGSRIAMYRVCTSFGCTGSAILKAFDDAIADGVDVLSLSLGSSPGEPDLINDPIALGAFHAVEKGITVVCSAGNSGDSPSTVVNVAPWILTVAASTIDRDFEANILLGGNKTIKGGGINFSELNKSPTYPLIDGSSAKSDSSKQDSSDDARNCVPGSLDDNKVKGKIVLCENKDDQYFGKEKYNVLKNQGAIGMVLVDNNSRQVPSKYGTSAMAIVNEDDGVNILSYINSTSNPVATILPTVAALDFKPAPVVSYFSSRGPVIGIKNLIKPDITAPGVAILAAWPSNDTDEALPGKEPPQFNILSGTSMSCPHVSGLAGAVKSQHPTWSPSAIRSAIMTTAISTNNQHAPITTNTGAIATPYDIGAGQISISGPVQPGLVYDTEVLDYLQFLCSMSYDTTKVKNISRTAPSDFSCPSNSGSDSISNMNYPSIAVSNLKQNEIKTVNRTVTNVGEQDSTYTAMVEAPADVQVEVVPDKLQFSKNVNKLSFRVTFKLTATSQGDKFGSITWSSTKYKVRSPFVVTKA